MLNRHRILLFEDDCREAIKGRGGDADGPDGRSVLSARACRVRLCGGRGVGKEEREGYCAIPLCSPDGSTRTTVSAPPLGTADPPTTNKNLWGHTHTHKYKSMLIHISPKWARDVCILNIIIYMVPMKFVRVVKKRVHIFPSLENF